MARVRMVTRTVTTQKVVALCLNIETAEPSNEVFEVPVNIKGEDNILKFLRKNEKDSKVKVVSINNITTDEHLYGMPEIEFIKHAKIIEKNADTINCEATATAVDTDN